MRRTAPYKLRSRYRNLVAKHADRFNKHQVHRDRLKEDKKGYKKHKKPVDID